MRHQHENWDDCMPICLISLRSLRAAKEPHHTDRAASWAGW